MPRCGRWLCGCYISVIPWLHCQDLRPVLHIILMHLPNGNSYRRRQTILKVWKLLIVGNNCSCWKTLDCKGSNVFSNDIIGSVSLFYICHVWDYSIALVWKVNTSNYYFMVIDWRTTGSRPTMLNLQCVISPSLTTSSLPCYRKLWWYRCRVEHLVVEHLFQGRW